MELQLQAFVTVVSLMNPAVCGVMFAASPGTITGVITLAVAHSRSELPVTTMIAVAGR